MQFQLIIHCVLLICLEFSASVPHGINPQKFPGIYNIKPPNEAYRQARIPRSHQVWNQRPPYPLPTQKQEFPQINRNPNIPNDHKRLVPNVPQNTPQTQFHNGYPNQHNRIPSNIARFPNVPNHVDKKNIKNISVAQNEPIQKISNNVLLAKHQPNLSSQFRRNIVSNPAALKQTVPRTAENFSKIVDRRQNNHNQKVPKGPFSVSSKSSVSKPEATVPFKGVAIKNEAFKSFVPLIPSRPLHTGTSKTKFNEHHVKIIPSIENIVPRVAPIPFEDRYFASASNPVETITRKLTPPRYDVKQFISNSNIRNVLATTKHKKRYLVILPNGTIEHVDKLESVVQRNPNYVLIQAGDIISNPIRKVEKVQEVAAKPVYTKKLQKVSVHTPVANTLKDPTANHQSTLLTAKNHIKLLRPVLVPPKQFITTAEAKLPITAKTTTIPSTPKAPTSHSSRHETMPNVTLSKIKKIFSKPSRNNNNPVEKINHKNLKKQIPVSTLNSGVSKPVHGEIKQLSVVEKPIVIDSYEEQRPINKPIIIYGANVTNDQETETAPATLAKPVEKVPVQETPVKEIVIKASVQTSKGNTPPVQEAVVVAEAVTETKPVVKDSTPVSSEEKVLPIEKPNKINVISKLTEGKPVKEIVVKSSIQTPKNNTPPVQEAVVVAEAVTETKPVVKDSTPVSSEEKVLPIEKTNEIDVIPKPTEVKPVKEIVVKSSIQTLKDNTPPVQEAVVVAEAVTETKPVVKDSNPAHEENVLLIEKTNEIDVIPKPTEGESASSLAASNAATEVKLTPHKTAVKAKTTTNSTERSTPEPKQHDITPTIPKETLEKDKKQPNMTAAESNDNPPKSTTNLPSKSEDKKEKHTPAIWFKTSDPAFWEQLRGENKEDVVLFFQIHNRPKVEYNTTRTIYPNGTIVEETTKSLWEIEGDPPIVTKTTQIINPDDQKR